MFLSPSRRALRPLGCTLLMALAGVRGLLQKQNTLEELTLLVRNVLNASVAAPVT